MGALESALAISALTLPPKISEQQLLDCQGTWSCQGGVPTDAFDYFISSPTGVLGTAAYPYTASTQTCGHSVVCLAQYP